MESIDYTSYLQEIILNQSEIQALLENQILVLQQANYLVMFIFGSIIALGLIILLKGLY